MTWHRIELALGVTLPLMAAAAASYYAHEHKVAFSHGRSHEAAVQAARPEAGVVRLSGTEWQKDAQLTWRLISRV